MKNSIRLAAGLMLAIVSLYMGKDVVPLFNNGITVKYQRVTGPEFVVLHGRENLKGADLKRHDVDCSEVFVANDLDKDIGILKASTYVISGDCFDAKSIEKGGQLYPVIHIRKIMAKTEYDIRSGIFVVSLMSLVGLILGVIRKRLSG
jgi:hypothetical protein